MRTALSLLLSATALLGASAAADAAATRYVAPENGFVNGQCATPLAACTLNRALNTVAVAGDTIAFQDGEHAIPAIVLTKQLHFKPAAGAAPTLAYTGTGAAIEVTDVADDSSFSGLKLTTTESASSALTASAPVTLDDMTIDAAGQCLGAVDNTEIVDSRLETAGQEECVWLVGTGNVLRRSTVSGPNIDGDGTVMQFGGPGAVMEDSRIEAPKGIAAYVYGQDAVVRRSHFTGGRAGIAVAPMSSVLITDTVATASELVGDAVHVVASASATLRNVTALAGGTAGSGLHASFAQQGYPGGTINARNVIARGGKHDVVVEDGGEVAIDHSNFATKAGAVTDKGANQSGDPLVNAGLSLLEGSPAIDAGVTDQATGTTDIDGNPRSQGGAPDLGAYESPFTAPPAAPAQPDPAAGAPKTAATPRLTSLTDITAPRVSGLKLTNRVFAVSAARPKGTVIRFKLSEAARVTVKLEKRCGKRNRKRCKAGTLTYAGKAGANELRFAGRVARKALKPGAYRASLIARDAAGNVSKPSSASFTVVKAG